MRKETIQESEKMRVATTVYEVRCTEVTLKVLGMRNRKADGSLLSTSTRVEYTIKATGIELWAEANDVMYFETPVFTLFTQESGRIRTLGKFTDRVKMTKWVKSNFIK